MAHPDFGAAGDALTQHRRGAAVTACCSRARILEVSEIAGSKDGIAFKVDGQGRPVPKGPEQIKNPYNNGTNALQHKTFPATVMTAGHRVSPP